MSLETQKETLKGLVLSGDFDQATTQLAQGWAQGLFLYVLQDLYGGGGVYKASLTASDAAAGLFSWQNSLGVPVLVSILVDLTTAASGACTADFGRAATEVSSDTLIDGLDLNAATGVFSSYENQGTNGRTWRRVANGEYVTGSVASGASAGLAGTVVLSYKATG